MPTRGSRGRIVVGHSDGSLIGLMAAQRSPVSHVVSLAGAGRPIGEVLDEQLGRGLPPALLADARRILAELKAGRTVDPFRPSCSSYSGRAFSHT